MRGQTVILVGETQRQFARNLIEKAPVDAVVNIQSKRRTNDQNAKLWALLSDISRAKPEGRACTPEVWKCLFMQACGHETQFELGLNGKPFPVGFSSSKLQVAEMADLITFVIQYGDEHGVQWSYDPHETNSDSADTAEPVGSADAPEGSSPSVRHSGALNHLAGEQRDLLLKFTREYYLANTQTSRVSIEDRYYKKVSEHEDVWALAVQIAALIKSRNIPELLNFIGRDEAWLKSAEAA